MRILISLILIIFICSVTHSNAQPAVEFNKNDYPLSTQLNNSTELTTIPLEKYSVNLGLEKTIPDSGSKAFFKPVGIGALTGLAFGGAIGLISGFPGTSNRKDAAVIWGYSLGIVGLGSGVVIGFGELATFNKRKKAKTKIIFK